MDTAAGTVAEATVVTVPGVPAAITAECMRPVGIGAGRAERINRPATTGTDTMAAVINSPATGITGVVAA